MKSRENYLDPSSDPELSALGQVIETLSFKFFVYKIEVGQYHLWLLLFHYLMTFNKLSLDCAGKLTKVTAVHSELGQGCNAASPSTYPEVSSSQTDLKPLEPLMIRRRFFRKTAFLWLVGRDSCACMASMFIVPGRLSQQQQFCADFKGRATCRLMAGEGPVF